MTELSVRNDFKMELGHLYVKHRDCISVNGYSKSLLISALQKYCRRGETKKALWCSAELLSFQLLNDPAMFRAYCALYPERDPAQETSEGKKPPHPKSLVQGILTNMANRLLVMSVEDVGIGHPGLTHTIYTLLAAWEASGRQAKEHIFTAVTMLATAAHLRLLSDWKSVYHLPPYYGANPAAEDRITEYIGWLRTHYDIPAETGTETVDTPDVGLLYYVARNIGTIKKNHPLWTVLLARIHPSLAAEGALLKKLYETTRLAETPLFLYQTIALALLPVVAAPALPVPSTFAIDKEKLQIDAYCNDKHVYGSGETSVTRFALEGALCAKELPHPYAGYRALYIHLKKAIDTKRALTREQLLAFNPVLQAAPPVSRKRASPEALESPDSKQLRPMLETDYTAPIRTQVTTSSAKADVVFATDPDGVFVCLKGPLQSAAGAENAIEMNAWKKALGLPHMPSLKVVYLETNRWPTGTPLGYRNKVNGLRAPFLVSAATLPEAVVRTNVTTYGALKKLKGTEKWPSDTILVDWRKVKSHICFAEFTAQEMLDYVLLLLARYIFGVSDLADRNFLLKEGRVYSIDEEYRAKPVHFLAELRKNRCLAIRTWLETHYTGCILPVVSEWPAVSVELLDKDTCIKLFM